ncbi:MAG TPA: hypothetical protein PLI22_07355, partial [Caldisericia bacterium]|nr:hypothetical protein [Caldisericia bacterium]
MRLDIRKDLKGIYNYLLNEDIRSYLLSDDFKEFCEKNLDIKEIWSESERYTNNMNFLLFSFRGKSELIEISFGIFLEKITNSGKEKFLEIILKIIKDFMKFKNREFNLNDIYKNIKNLNYT